MEVFCNAVTVILNWHITSFIVFHDTLHGFRVGRLMVTASLESKLLQKLREISEAVLYGIFLDFQKAYYAMDRYLCQDILTVYGMVSR